MARKKLPLSGKLRTREHVLADLAVNQIEGQALRCSYSIERVFHDYGIDLLMFTYTPAGELQPSFVSIQVKGTERLKWSQAKGVAPFRIAREDLVGWSNELLPVILIGYDASKDCAYWIHIQGYFASLSNFNLFRAGKRVTVHLPMKNVLDETAVLHFDALRAKAG